MFAPPEILAVCAPLPRGTGAQRDGDRELSGEAGRLIDATTRELRVIAFSGVQCSGFRDWG